MLTRPEPGQYSDYFQGYIDRVPEGDVMAVLREQGERMSSLLHHTSEAKGSFAYAPGRWSVKRLVLHITDGERMFCYRAMCVARGDQQALPDFDQDIYAENDDSDERTLASIAAEYASVRSATLTLFGGFGAKAWQRQGTANGQPVTAACLPWIIAGHDLHHFSVLVERYGLRVN